MLALHIAKIIKVFMVLGHFLTSNFIIFLKGKFSRIHFSRKTIFDELQYYVFAPRKYFLLPSKNFDIANLTPSHFSRKTNFEEF